MHVAANPAVKLLCEQEGAIVPVRGRDDIPGILGAPRGQGLAAVGLDEDERLRVFGADSAGKAIDERLDVILIEIDRAPTDLAEIIRAQQLGRAVCSQFPDAVLPPDAFVVRQPGAHPAGVEQPVADLFGAARAELPDIHHLRQPIAQLHGLEGRRHIADLEAIRGSIQVRLADVAGAGLVERVIAQHFRPVFELAGHLLEGVHEVGLQVLLDRHAVHFGLRGKVVAGEEEREHAGGGQFLVVGGPEHGRQRPLVFRLGDGCAGGLEVGNIQPGCLEGPAGGAIPTGKTAPDIFMRIN